jgi:Ca2+-binding EF-hand superfamily protein
MMASIQFFPRCSPPHVTDAQEFVAVMSRKVNATYTPDEVKAAFKVFEGSAPPGHVKLSALQRALATYGSEKLTAEQAAEEIFRWLEGGSFDPVI